MESPAGKFTQFAEKHKHTAIKVLAVTTMLIGAWTGGKRYYGTHLLQDALEQVPDFAIPPAPTKESVEAARTTLQDAPHTEHLAGDIRGMKPAELVHKLLEHNPGVILADDFHRSQGVARAIIDIVANREYGIPTHYFPEKLPPPENSATPEEDLGIVKKITYANPNAPGYCLMASPEDGLSPIDKTATTSTDDEQKESLRNLETAVSPTKVVFMDYQSDALAEHIPAQIRAANIANYALHCYSVSEDVQKQYHDLEQDFLQWRFNESNPKMAGTISSTLKPEIESGHAVQAIISVGAGHSENILDLNEMLHLPVIHLIPARNIETPTYYHGGIDHMDFTLVVPDKEVGYHFDPCTYPGLRGPQSTLQPEDTAISGRNHQEICR